MVVPPPLSAPPALTRRVERRLDSIAASVVTEWRAAPAASVATGSLASPALLVGAAGQGERESPIAPSTLFDLASVSKPLVACTLLRLERHGALSLAQALALHLPELRQTPSASATLLHLLSHRAGLEAHLPLFAPLLGGLPVVRSVALRRAALARRAECLGPPPAEGFSPVYSDLGYLLAGEVAERVTGLPLDELVDREVGRPLGLRLGSARQWHRWAPERLAQAAPTEHVLWRGGRLRGVVHDDNAWALGGLGLCGHAGVFGAAVDVVGWGLALLDALEGRRPTWLLPEQLETLVRPRPGGTLRAGFDGKASAGSSAGTVASERTFGHLGFTGTSLWIDPATGRAVALLTNRVFGGRDDLRLRGARPALHDALFRAQAESDALDRGLR